MNLIQNIAIKIREHYLQRFIEEYSKQNEMIAIEEKEGRSNCSNRRLLTDCELEFFPKEVKLASIKQVKPANENKLYRRDIVVFRDMKPSEILLCWPVRINEEDDFAEEDIPRFHPFFGEINQIEIEIRPFPWFQCNLVFYPNADNIKGIMDCWFYKWYYTIRKPDPFLNVIHRIDGPYIIPEGGELYSIDFGSALPEAFCDLIYQVCRNGVKKLLIY